jgi:sialic acid synthase SpsE
LLKKINIPAFKIGSGELTNLPFIYQIAKYNKPIILSTGMSTMKEIDKAIKTIYRAGNKKLIVLHCTTNYPTEYKNVNLKALQTIRNKFKVMVGFSDHTKDDLAAICSLGAGAVMIEKHFTLDRKMSGPDHKASIEPEELKSLVEKIRKVEIILGSNIKAPCKSELKVKQIVQKSIFSAKNIKAGQIITAKMLEIKRPVIGELPESFEKIVGKKAKKNILVHEPIYFRNIK